MSPSSSCASGFVIGAVLGQRKDKRFHPISFANRMLDKAQQAYTTTDKAQQAYTISVAF